MFVGPPLQGHPVILHSPMVVWVGKSYGKPPSVVWSNNLKTEWLICLKVGQTDKSYTSTTRLKFDCLSRIYPPINAQIVWQTCSILNTAITRKHSILSGSSWQDNHYTSTINAIILRNIKVLLRHLERRYTAIRINNHVESANGMRFLSDKFPYLFKSLTNFIIRGVCLDKPFKQPFVQIP